MRTEDRDYGEEYFETLDNGQGYVDSVLWEDIAKDIKEVFGYDWENQKDISPSLNICDFGCAKGYLVRHLRRRGFDAWGLDVSTYALEHAPEDTKEFLRWTDMTSADGTYFGEEQFDLAVCLETMEHIPKPFLRNAFSKVFLSLKPGGFALYAICTRDQPGWDTDPTHYTMEGYSFWENRLEKAGFVMRHDLRDKFKNFWLFAFHHGVFVVQKPS